MLSDVLFEHGNHLAPASADPRMGVLGVEISTCWCELRTQQVWRRVLKF